MNDALLVRDLKRFGNLLGNQQGFIDGYWALRDAVSERWAFDELHHQRAGAIGLLESVDLGNVGVVERGERFGSRSKRASLSGSFANVSGSTLIAT